GNLYDYYLTGFFPIFVLLFSYVLLKLPWFLVLPVLGFFFYQNLPLNYYYLRAGVDGPTHITLGNQKQVIDWICVDAGGQSFNVDTYVPPVIPYAWDYLWAWYGQRQGCNLTPERSDLLYTVWEVDPPHPERLEVWLARQRGIGRIDKEFRFGGIGGERRTRIND
ncbi:MAG: hypothetical protein ABID04_03240, partial [Patescibacteria group bacterium]